MKSRFYLLDDNEIEWEGKPCVRFWGVGEKGKRICVLSNQIMPYFYFLPNEQDNLETSRQRILEDKKRFPKILSVSIESKKLLGEERRALKITCEESDVRSSYSKELQKLLGKGEGFENDLRLSARYITDLMLTPCGWNECEVSKSAFDGPYDAVRSHRSSSECCRRLGSQPPDSRMPHADCWNERVSETGKGPNTGDSRSN